MVDVNLRESEQMKSIISMSVGFALLISHVFGSAVDIMEGAIGEAEATASFFEREVSSVVAKIEQAVAAFKSTFQGSNRAMIPDQQASAIKLLEANTEALADLAPLLANSRAQAEKMRLMLDAMRKDSEDKSIAE